MAVLSSDWSNVCRWDYMKQNIFHILGGKPLTLLQDPDNWPRYLHREALTMHKRKYEDTWYYSFQDPSRHFLTYEEGRYFLTIQISGWHILLLLKRANIVLRWQGIKYLFFIMIWWLGGDIFGQIPAPPPPWKSTGRSLMTQPTCVTSGFKFGIG